MKFPIRLLSVCVLLLMTPLANAQIFPNAFWNKNKANQTCSGPECQGQQSIQIVTTEVQPAPQPVRNFLRAVAGPVVYESVQTVQNVPLQSYGCTGSAPLQSYGCTGSITSYSTVTTESYGSSGSSVESLRRKSSFRPAFLEAVKRAKESGQINAFQARILTRKSANDRWLADVESDVRAAAIEEGVTSATGQIDWDAIISFIEKLIPLIIQLIDLFGYSTHLNPDIQYAYDLQPSYYLAA